MKFEIGCPSSDKPTSIDIPLCGSCLFDHVYVALHAINLQPAGNAWPILSLIVAQRIGEKPVLFFFLRKHVQSSSDSVFYLLAWKSIMLHVTTCYNRHVAGHGPPGEKPIVAVVRGRQEPFGGQEVFVAGGSDGFWMEKWCVEMDVFFGTNKKLNKKRIRPRILQRVFQWSWEPTWTNQIGMRWASSPLKVVSHMGSPAISGVVLRGNVNHEHCGKRMRTELANPTVL